MAILGAAVGLAFACVQLRATSHMVEQHSHLTRQAKEDLEAWRRDLDALKDEYVLDVEDLAQHMQPAYAADRIQANADILHWLDEYKELKIKLQALQLKLKDIEHRIVANLGEAKGRKTLHTTGMVTSGINLAVTAFSVVNPWMWLAVGLHVGAFGVHWIGMNKAERTVGEWKALGEQSKLESRDAQQAVDTCQAILQALNGLQASSHKSLKQIIASAKKTITDSEEAQFSVFHF